MYKQSKDSIRKGIIPFNDRSYKITRVEDIKKETDHGPRYRCRLYVTTIDGGVEKIFEYRGDLGIGVDNGTLWTLSNDGYSYFKGEFIRVESFAPEYRGLAEAIEKFIPKHAELDQKDWDESKRKNKKW